MDKIQPYLLLLKEIIPDFQGDLELNLDQLNIDSFDLLSLRANLEEKLGHTYSDSEWISVKKISDILALGKTSSSLVLNQSHNSDTSRTYKLNMPQMAMGGLSESWYFKEIGDMHWFLISKALNKKSNEITDHSLNRLYATFIRIKYESNLSFNQFEENDDIDLRCELHRYGSFFVSKNDMSSYGISIKAELITSFVSRGHDNTSLFKTNPSNLDRADTPLLQSTPDFLLQYHKIRKNEIASIPLMGLNIEVSNSCIYSTTYDLNPYSDLNGVNLLYFAAYPMIFDICERKFCHSLTNNNKEWSMISSPIARDIYYLGNANISDQLTYTVNSYQFQNDLFIIQATLARSIDETVIAKQFCIKKIRQKNHE